MNNPPAFPQRTPPELTAPSFHGMTLRDYFAAHCLEMVVNTLGLNEIESEEIARRSFELADAMMEARQQ